MDPPLKRVAVTAKTLVLSNLRNTKYLVSRLNIVGSTLDALPAWQPRNLLSDTSGSVDRRMQKSRLKTKGNCDFKSRDSLPLLGEKVQSCIICLSEGRALAHRLYGAPPSPRHHRLQTGNNGAHTRVQNVWAYFDVGRRGYIGLHNWKKFLAALKKAKCPLASKAHHGAWERPICYEAWQRHLPNKGLQFSDAILILLHDKFGRHVRPLPTHPCALHMPCMMPPSTSTTARKAKWVTV